jgi:hypothetical protein
MPARYALFTLVGIAGEDDLDAPNLVGQRQISLFGPRVATANKSMPAANGA